MEPSTQQARDRILSEAAALFVQHGYDGISMREIAQACAISKAGIYYHFKDKEDLFLAVLSDNLARLTGLLTEACQEDTPAPECIARFSNAIFTRMDSIQRAMIRLANQEMGKLSPDNRAAFGRRYQDTFIAPLTAILSSGVQRGQLRPLDPRLATWVLLGILYPFLSPGSEFRLDDPARAVTAAMDIYFHGTIHA